MSPARKFALAALAAAAFFAIGPRANECLAQQPVVEADATPAPKKTPFLKWAKKNHLNYYVAGYSGVMALLAGISIAGLSYRYSERSKLYGVAKARTTAWAGALGLGIGVAVAVMQVPSVQQGKLKSLLISVAIAGVATPAITYATFVFIRRLHIRQAGKRGRRSSERMDLL